METNNGDLETGLLNDKIYSNFVGLKCRVMVYCIIEIGFAIALLIWSIYNSIQYSFDIGVISFIFPLFAGIFGILSTKMIKNPKNKYLTKGKIFGKIHFIILIIAHFMGALHYIGELWGEMHCNGGNVKKSLQTMYIIGFIAWVITGFIFGVWADDWTSLYCKYTYKQP